MKLKTFFLSFATLILLFGLSLSINAQTSLSQSVSPKEAFKLLEKGAVLIDVRELEELEEVAYNVANKIHIPLGTLENNLQSIPKEKPVILACKGGGRSQEAYDLLKEKGFTNITNLEGGILAWENEGLTVTKGNETSNVKKSCCADSSNKKCNPDGTCKGLNKKENKACCSADKKSKGKKAKACCQK